MKEAGGKLIVQVPERFWRFYNLDRKHKGGFDKREQSFDNGCRRHSRRKEIPLLTGRNYSFVIVLTDGASVRMPP